MGWQDILTAGITGFATGGLGTIFAPWANWGVEKRRHRRQTRAERIVEWRKGVEELRRAGEEEAALGRVPGQPRTYRVPPDDKVMAADRLADVLNKSWFNTLKPMLSDTTLESIDALRVQRRRDEIADGLEVEISRIERNWELV